LMAALKTMDVQSPERYLTADDANRLSMEIMDNVVATQVVDGEYVPDADMLTLKDIITSSLQLQNVDVGNFTSKIWESVYWDPIYARPDTVSSYLNKVLNINQGNHTVSKSSSYNDKDDESANIGIKDLFTFGGSSGSQSSSSASYSELHEWLLQHNYDVEIKGELFVPKSLALKRLNLGVLNRQETIFTKSVQLHHIDAPGTLTVTVGSRSIADSEDVKKLRERLNQLEPRTAQLEGRMGQVEPTLANVTVEFRKRIDQVESKLTNATIQETQLDAKIESVRITLTNELGKKVSTCTLVDHCVSYTQFMGHQGCIQTVQAVQCAP